eukprot:CAMPEP_0177766646 /NCGR_PEP_ID=MMETSP0491_2-20121128/8633_1 /TAXON_ID=63592 /ORGANISM="Tetraselmis chuii, Strain PLY429" /LENGTH=109 /DNA_ID=CAMNT_0019283069 /DNA_START=344 /DNA_END=673 /DNA_ORIENTATION=+
MAMSRATTTSLLVMLVFIGLFCASAQARSLKNEKFPYDHMDAYAGQNCKEANIGTYNDYTLWQCLTKCQSRGCDAFVYRSELSQDNVCKLYNQCSRKDGNDGEMLFIVE